MARALLLVGILLTMLIISVLIKRGNDDKLNAGLKAEQSKNAATLPAPKSVPVPGAVSAAETAPRPIGHGLTFGLAAAGGSNALADQGSLTHLSCHGEPRQVNQPHRDSCNPYKGDTSCRVVLPVLCFQGKGLPQPPQIQAAVSGGVGWGDCRKRTCDGRHLDICGGSKCAL